MSATDNSFLWQATGACVLFIERRRLQALGYSEVQAQAGRFFVWVLAGKSCGGGNGGMISPSRMSFISRSPKVRRFYFRIFNLMKTFIDFRDTTSEKNGHLVAAPLAITRAALPKVDLRDWVSQIQAAYAREASDVLELARLMSRVHGRLPYGSWGRLWESREMRMPFKKRKGDMLVTIGRCVEGLDAQSSAQLPAAWNTLYYLARLGCKLMEKLISEGRIHPGLSLEEAKALLAQYRPGNRRTTSRSKLQRRLDAFAVFVREKLGTWLPQEREMVAEKLAALAAEVRAASSQTL
jgi:hypothetical protein